MPCAYCQSELQVVIQTVTQEIYQCTVCNAELFIGESNHEEWYNPNKKRYPLTVKDIIT